MKKTEGHLVGSETLFNFVKKFAPNYKSFNSTIKRFNCIQNPKEEEENENETIS